MIKGKEDLLRKLLILLDAGVVCIAFFISFLIRDNVQALYTLDIFPEKQIFGDLYSMFKYLNMLPVVLFGWWTSLSISGLYESFRAKSFFEMIWGIMRSAVLVMVLFATVVFLFKLDFISRTFIFVLFSITALSLIMDRWFIVSILRFFRKKGYNFRNILLVGTGPRARNFIKMVRRHSEWGFRIMGIVDAEKKMLGKTVNGIEVIGLLKDIPGILTENVVDEAIFIVPRKWMSIIEDSLLACEIQGVRTNIATDFFNMKIARWSASDIEGIPMLGFNTTVASETQLFLKRLFDIILATVGIIITFPILVALYVVIKIFSPGGLAVFKQLRSGLNGREFIMYKFRTMIEGAEKKKKGLKSLNEMNGPVFKMRKDPRVTKFGKFLRRTSLDELPQLFNILKGNMSLVGPRPPIPSEVNKYEIWQRRRLSMKPGLTCLWQINGRNNVDFDKWMQMDLEYIDNWSLALDFKILFKTAPAVLFSIGAR